MNNQYLGNLKTDILLTSHDIDFNWYHVNYHDHEWQFVLNVREETFNDVLLDILGCLDSGLL